jgi:hypothetical protein
MNNNMTEHPRVNDTSTENLWLLLTEVIVELKSRGALKGNNVIGYRGESLAVTLYNETPGLPKLQLAPPSTQNIDAISVKGKTYSIKTVSFPNKTTGVFHGYGNPEQPLEDKLFDYLIVVQLKGFAPFRVIQMSWETFFKHKRWHSTMNAYNISLTKGVLEESEVIFEV